jgi:heat shock protein HslJ
MTKLFLPLLAAAALVLGACGSDSSSGDSPDLDGREFLSTSVEGHDLVPGTDIRIAFTDGSLSANAGCNTMGGDYSLDGNMLEVGPMFSTEMGCEPPLMDQDTWLADFLTSGPAVSLDGDELMLGGNDGTTINMLDRESADPDRPIEGTVWVVDGIVANEAVSTVPGGTTASITITDGTAAVETGCNAGSTSVEITDTTLTFSPMAVTMMACPPDETELQDAVLAVLDGEVTYEIEADRLSIRRTTPQGEIGLDLRSSE